MYDSITLLTTKGGSVNTGLTFTTWTGIITRTMREKNTFIKHKTILFSVEQSGFYRKVFYVCRLIHLQLRNAEIPNVLDDFLQGHVE